MMTRRALVTAAGLSAFAAARPVRAAVYGIGHAHAMGKVAALRALPQFELVGVCEPDSSRPRTHKALAGVRWLSQREMIEDSSIELIAVESRVQENLAYARQAVDSGKFVHLDKAPGTDFTAFRDLLAEAGRRRRTVQIGYQWRYHPAMQAALEAARSGWLGDVYSFRARIDKPTTPADRKELAAFRGGMMFELGCHLIDRATDLLGNPTRVSGHLWHHGRENDTLADNTLAVLEYPRAVAEISVAAMHPHGNSYRTVEVTGTNGSVTVQPFSPYRLISHLRDAAGPYPAGLQKTEFPPDHLPGFSPDFLEMARIIREGATPSYSPQHDLVTQEVLLKSCQELT
jgi:predicted dehydrogenase